MDCHGNVICLPICHPGSEKAGSPLRTLTQMQASAVNFAHALARTLAGAEQGDVVGVARAVYAPYEAQIARRADGSQ
jgi:hypothetical protein